MFHVGQKAEWNELFKKYMNESSAMEKDRLLDGLCNVQSSSLITK